MKHFRKIQNTRPAVICGLGILFLFSCTAEQDEARSDNTGSIEFSPQTTEYASFSKIEAPQCRDEGGAFPAYYLGSVLVGKEEGDSLFLHTCCLTSIPYHLTGMAGWNRVKTRGTEMTSLEMYGAFGISAFCYMGTWNASLSPDFMHNERVTLSGGLWGTDKTYYWPGGGYNMRFFAYAPVDSENYLVSDKQYKGTPTLTCTIPAQTPLQQDLLVASSGEINGAYSRPIPLKFRHVLTAVKFSYGNLPDIEIKSISLNSVNNSGIYNMENQNWLLNTSLQNFSLQVSSPDRPDPTAEKNTFMMLPQTLPENAEIEITYQQKDGEKRKRIPISGHSWRMGYTIIYHLNHSSNPKSFFEEYAMQEDWGEEITVKFDPIRLW